MRTKRSTQRRAATDGRAGGTADWILANEAGWGFPHGDIALLAGLVVAARAIGWLGWGLAGAIDRYLRDRRGHA